MKKLMVSAAVVVVLVGLSSFVVTAWGQGQQSRTADDQPHKIGLIDMAHIFKNYSKFESLRDDLKQEIEQSDRKAKQMAQQIKALQQEMQQFKEGSPDFVQREKKLAELTSEFETYRKVEQREFMRKESQIYKTVYLEAAEAVQKYAQYYGYTLIIRFNREGVDSAEDPQTVIQRMNRQVVYHAPDNDITDAILGYLNKEYQKSASGGTTAPKRSAGKPAGTRR